MESYIIKISDIACQQIKQQLKNRNTPDGYLRLGVNGSGCSGYKYLIKFDDTGPNQKDIYLNISDINIIIDKKSIIYLNNITLDWNKSLMKQGFEIINPLETSKCGCGKSVQLKQ